MFSKEAGGQPRPRDALEFPESCTDQAGSPHLSPQTERVAFQNRPDPNFSGKCQKQKRQVVRGTWAELVRAAALEKPQTNKTLPTSQIGKSEDPEKRTIVWESNYMFTKNRATAEMTHKSFKIPLTGNVQNMKILRDRRWIERLRVGWAWVEGGCRAPATGVGFISGDDESVSELDYGDGGAYTKNTELYTFNG